jgi:hypothetical protein
MQTRKPARWPSNCSPKEKKKKKKTLFSNLFEDAQIRVNMTSIKEG